MSLGIFRGKKLSRPNTPDCILICRVVIIYSIYTHMHRYPRLLRNLKKLYKMKTAVNLRYIKGFPYFKHHNT